MHESVVDLKKRNSTQAPAGGRIPKEIADSAEIIKYNERLSFMGTRRDGARGKPKVSEG